MDKLDDLGYHHFRKPPFVDCIGIAFLYPKKSPNSDSFGFGSTWINTDRLWAAISRDLQLESSVLPPKMVIYSPDFRLLHQVTMVTMVCVFFFFFAFLHEFILWGFPSHRIFHHTPSNYWGAPHLTEPPLKPHQSHFYGYVCYDLLCSSDQEL